MVSLSFFETPFSRTLVPEVSLHFSSFREAANSEHEPQGDEKENGLESHLHADANCQTRQIDNYSR